MAKEMMTGCSAKAATAVVRFVIPAKKVRCTCTSHQPPLKMRELLSAVETVGSLRHNDKRSRRERQQH